MLLMFARLGPDNIQAQEYALYMTFQLYIVIFSHHGQLVSDISQLQ